jgi:putative endopeptidase
MKTKTIFLLALLSACACQQKKNSDEMEGKVQVKLLDPANMDTSIHAGDNFFYYANGSWLKKNPIPPSQTRWGSFNVLQENNFMALHALLKEAAADKEAKGGSPKQKVGDFFSSGMDSMAIQKAGITPLRSIFDSIDHIRDIPELLHQIAFLQTKGLDVIFSFGISPDEKNVTKYICQFGQGGLGMPDRDYYFNKDERTVKIKDAYKKYLVKMMTLVDRDSLGAEKKGEGIYKLETSLAKASMTRTEMRDPYKLYNKYDLQGLNKLAPAIDWKSFFRQMHMEGQDSCIISAPDFFREVAAKIISEPLPVWKNYLKFHVANGLAPYMSSEVDTLHFAFYGKTIRGQQEQKTRWKRVLTVIDQSIGELLGQMYVEKHFRPDAKKRMLDLVNNLQQTYAGRITRLDWMSETTKKKALAKLNTFVKKIGYPDTWKNYDLLHIQGNDYVANVLSASAFEYNYSIRKLGKPVDKNEWGMTPPTVNAYYNPLFNEIVFPAGILQYPFFEEAADDAINYGGIGAVIGHEMTHGFDDEGRQYDANGNLHDWWTPEDADKFNKKSEVVVKQFYKYTVLDSLHVNGKLTLGENLADLGGLTIAYEAFKKTPQGRENNKTGGFTPDQRFFLSWAQVWRGNTRPEELAARLITDPHSPNELRCNGPLSNMQQFYTAFAIKPTDKLYRPDSLRAKIW